MFLHDLQSEMAFYGRELDVIGHLYTRPADLPAKYPDVLFILQYTCSILVDKKMTLRAAQQLMDRLKLGPELEKCANWEEIRPFTFPARIIPYRELLDALWRAAAALGNVPLGKELNQGNCQDSASRLYLRVTGDGFPALMKSLNPKFGPVPAESQSFTQKEKGEK